MTQLTTYYKAAPTSPEFSPDYSLFLQKTFKQTGLSPAPAPLHPKAGDCQPNRISQWTFSKQMALGESRENISESPLGQVYKDP